MKKINTRKEKLVERIALQRVELATNLQNLQRPFSMFDKGYAIAQKLRQQPKWLIGSALLVVFIFRKRLYAMMKRVPLLTVIRWWLLKV
jgi:hypothetical protein